MHSINNDKTVNLHTRNAKYGRLEPGVLVEVDHKLVCRQKHHMIQLGVLSLIISNNGKIWISNVRRNDSLEAFALRKTQEEYTVEQIRGTSLVHNILKYLDWQKL